jgi:hypothetical protein
MNGNTKGPDSVESGPFAIRVLLLIACFSDRGRLAARQDVLDA